MKINATTAEALLQRNFAPREHVIGPWLRNGESAVVWSASGVGKTMLCLSIALAVAGGGSIGDWDAPTPRRVLYVDGEMNVQDIQERIQHLLQTNAVVLPEKNHSEALRNLVMIVSREMV